MKGMAVILQLITIGVASFLCYLGIVLQERGYVVAAIAEYALCTAAVYVGWYYGRHLWRGDK